jgi:uncharacterized protein (TIGR02594 family)
VSVDPLQHEYPHYTPYQYAGNKPITYIDLDGLEEFDLREDEIQDTLNNPTQDNPPNTDNGENLEVPALDIYEHLESLGIDVKNIYYEKIEIGDYVDFGNGNIQQITFVINIVESREKTETPWMDVAFKEYESGVARFRTGDNPRIVEYIKSTSLTESCWNQSTAWCAAFTNWTLNEVGINGPKDAAYGPNWESWGVELDEPAYGAIAIFNTGHVGFVAGETEQGKLIMLHGNWSNMVNYTDYTEKSEIKSYVYPKGYKPNYNMPKTKTK